MKSHTRAAPWLSALLRATARALCPPAQKPWVDAVFAEASTLEDRASRAAWEFGAFSVAVTGVRGGAAALPHKLRGAILLASTVAVLAALASAAGYEGLAFDDDVFLSATLLSSVATVCLAVTAARRIFAGPEHGDRGSNPAVERTPIGG